MNATTDIIIHGFSCFVNTFLKKNRKFLKNQSAGGINRTILPACRKTLFKIPFEQNPYARSTLLERIHLVHTYMVFGVPLSMTWIFLILGFQVLLDLLWEWETLIPKVTPFPQTSHFAIYQTPPTEFFIRYKTAYNIISDFFLFCKLFLKFFIEEREF